MRTSRFPSFLRWVVAMCLAMVCLGAQGKVYLVSVGITDYPGTFLDLRVPARDAKTISLIYYKNAPLKYRQESDREEYTRCHEGIVFQGWRRRRCGLLL